jgi:tetratricopeptide (TPR) repeat protein
MRRPALAAGAPVLLEGARAGAARLARSLRPPVGRTAALVLQLWRSAPHPRMGSLEPRALAALASLIAVFAVAIAIALGELAHKHPPSAGPARGPAQHLREASRNGPPAQGAAAPRQPQPAPPASAVVAAAAGAQLASADAVTLESEGHQLLAEGSYTRAIGTLASAVRASGKSPARCSEPASEACLTLAYALYDLGRALRLEGRQAEAIAVLSERLSIDNQRATVQHELDLARGAPA